MCFAKSPAQHASEPRGVLLVPVAPQCDAMCGRCVYVLDQSRSAYIRDVEPDVQRQLCHCPAHVEGPDQSFEGSGSHIADRVRGQVRRCTAMSVSWPMVLEKKSLEVVYE